MYLKKGLLLVSIACLTSCATLQPEIGVQSFGEVNISSDKEIQKRANNLGETPSDVKVVSGVMPEGLELAEQGHKLIVLAGYENKYKVLGSVDSAFDKDGYAGLRSGYWTPEFYGKDQWRKGLCYPQAPLKLLSFGLWNIVPLAWPCWSAAPSDETERKALLIESLAKGVKEMGGNVLIVTGSQSTNITFIRDGYAVGGRNVGMTGSQGFAVLAK